VAVGHAQVGVGVAERVECGGLPPLFEDRSPCIPIPYQSGAEAHALSRSRGTSRYRTRSCPGSFRARSAS